MSKYNYLWIVQAYYSPIWEDLAATSSDKWIGAREALEFYQENGSGRYRLIQRRELKGKS